jgi:hypothetical protein
MGECTTDHMNLVDHRRLGHWEGGDESERLRDESKKNE